VQLNDFYYGDWQEAHEGRVATFPLNVVNIATPVGFDNQVTNLIVNVIVCDQVAKDHSNLDEVESDTLQILHDLYKVVRNAENWQRVLIVTRASAAVKFRDATPDEVAGWQMQLSVKMAETSGLCDIPLDGYSFTDSLKC
jgi:hypothetical protein